MIAHVSPTRTYGGPNTVALTQAEALRERGHEVFLVAGTEGFPVGTAEVGGVDARLFPSRKTLGGSFAYRWTPGLLSFVRRVAPNFDVAHIHLARDFTTLPSALALNIPMVVQPHGMLTSRRSALHQIADLLFMNRAIHRADSVVAITEHEAGLLRARFGPLSVTVVENTVPARGSHTGSRAEDRPMVLFLARLQERKRPLLFVEAALDLIAHGSTAQFIIAGPDEGQGERVTRALADVPEHHIRWVGAVNADEAEALMASASAYVLPARDEPFGMTLLEAVNHGTPVISDETADLGRRLSAEGLGTTFDGTPADLSRVMREVLCDHELAERARALGPSAVQERWGSARAAERLEEIYESVRQ